MSIHQIVLPIHDLNDINSNNIIVYCVDLNVKEKTIITSHRLLTIAVTDSSMIYREKVGPT